MAGAARARMRMFTGGKFELGFVCMTPAASDALNAFEIKRGLYCTVRANGVKCQRTTEQITTVR